MQYKPFEFTSDNIHISSFRFFSGDLVSSKQDMINTYLSFITAIHICINFKIIISGNFVKIEPWTID